MKKILNGIIAGIIFTLAVILGLKRNRNADEKIKQIESEVKKDVEKMSDTAVIQLLNHTLASRAGGKRK